MPYSMTTIMKIVIPEKMHEDAVHSLGKKFETIYNPALVDQPQGLKRLLQDADALIVRKDTRVDAYLLDAAPKLRVVGRLGIGLDNFDLDACKARDVAVIRVSDTNKQSVAEYVIGAALVLLRPVFLGTADVLRGTWPRLRHFHDHELCGKTLGLIGFGNIGRHTARLAGRLGMRVIAHDPFVPETAHHWHELDVESRSLNEVLSEADVVSIHVPLLDSTRNLMNRERIGLMKRGAILINASRGGIVDEQAVVGALKSRYLSGAALDVFVQEPLPDGTIFADVPNLLLTPHVAGITLEAEARTAHWIAERITEFLERL